MSEKVKVTKEQHEAIQELLSTVIDLFPGISIDFIIDEHGKDKGYAKLVEHGITVSMLAKYFYIGYEVEEEKKEGTWIKWKSANGTVYGQIDTTAFDDIVANFSDGVRRRLNKDDVDFMTEEEVAQEKERQFWKSLGRDVWEFKPGDIVIHDSDFYYNYQKEFNITSVNKIKNGLVGVRNNEKLVKKENLILVTPVEQRLDIKHGA